MQETWVRSLDWEDSLQEGMATHSSTLARRIPWTEEPGGLQSMGSQRVGHTATNAQSRKGRWEKEGPRPREAKSSTAGSCPESRVGSLLGPAMDVGLGPGPGRGLGVRRENRRTVGRRLNVAGARRRGNDDAGEAPEQTGGRQESQGTVTGGVQTTL